MSEIVKKSVDLTSDDQFPNLNLSMSSLNTRARRNTLRSTLRSINMCPCMY